jgi:hypothetical protein
MDSNDNTLVRIGCAAGFAGDRFDASETVIEYLEQYDGPKYLMFEVLAERTLAITKTLQREDPCKGYSPFLHSYLEPVIKRCHAAGIKIVTNAGASNPKQAGKLVNEMAIAQGMTDYRTAVVEGDNLFEKLSEEDILNLEKMDDVEFGRPLLSANVYLGAAGIVEALQASADIIITGRVSDPALALGPLIYEFGWTQDDWDSLAAGTLVGHIIECGCQVTGATFVDPGRKDRDTLSAPGLSAAGIARMGYPIAEVSPDGSAVITKLRGTGGLVSLQTVKEQMLYEIHDPGAYITPDVILDMTSVCLQQTDVDRVLVKGARGAARPEKLKATVSFDGGWLAEAGLSYAGSNSLARARFAIEVIEERIKLKNFKPSVRFDIIGLASILDDDSGTLRHATEGNPDGDYRIRAAVRTQDESEAEWLVSEVLALWAAGPAGAAGFRESISAQVFTGSVLIDRQAATAHRISILEINL